LEWGLLLSWGVAPSWIVKGFQPYFDMRISIESGCSSDNTPIKNSKSRIQNPLKVHRRRVKISPAIESDPVAQCFVLIQTAVQIVS
jgi:hypothetical protein